MLFSRLPGRLFTTYVFTYLSIGYSQIIGQKTIAAIRVSFIEDVIQSTTGNGLFLLDGDNQFCGDYTIDPVPHDRDYFRSQLVAVDSYFNQVSYQQLSFDLDNSVVFPKGNTDSYQLPHTMDYYHPYGEDNISDQRLAELFRDAVEASYDEDQIDFSAFDIVVVFHAGVGQDFALPFLDPTPEDIPSTFIDNVMIQENLGASGIQVGGVEITEGILLPETQNHLLFEDLRDAFGTEFSACEYQFGLTGTFSLMMGFLLGLPPLWDIETGQSGIGVFGLMDQGSNNGRGLIPAPPNSWTRIFAGWETALPSNIDGSYTDVIIRSKGSTRVAQVDEDEYFLIENRNNTLRESVSIDSLRYLYYLQNDNYPPYVQILFDSTNVDRDTNGVVTHIPNYDIGLPNSGLLIWHIDASRIQQGIGDYSINSNPNARGVDLEEADGAKDIGFPSIFPFNDPSAGYFADMWYKGNQEYYRFNPYLKREKLVFGPFTMPNTRNNENVATHISIDSIGVVSDTMYFIVRNEFLQTGFPIANLRMHLGWDIDGDGTTEYIVGKDSLSITTDLFEGGLFFHAIRADSFQVLLTNFETDNDIAIVEIFEDSIMVSVFNSSENQVELEWQQTGFVGSDFNISGFPDTNLVTIKTNTQRCVFGPDSVACVGISDTNEMASLRSEITVGGTTTVTNVTAAGIGRVTIDEFEINNLGRIQQVAMVDLDISQDAELLVLSETGVLHALHENTTFVSGFPFSENNIERFLVQNLFADGHPEIVLQNTDKDLFIYNWKGKLQYRLGNPTNGKLVQLGAYRNKNAIFTSDAIWTFDDTTSSSNAWPLIHADPAQTNIFKLNYQSPFENTSSILDNRKTYAYPNPAENGYVKIRCTVNDADKITCEIFDFAGYFVRRFTNNQPVNLNPNEFYWDVSGVEPGVYFATVRATNGVTSKSKILKIGVLQ